MLISIDTIKPLDLSLPDGSALLLAFSAGRLSGDHSQRLLRMSDYPPDPEMSDHKTHAKSEKWKVGMVCL
jgi:hypothetical protein